MTAFGLLISDGIIIKIINRDLFTFNLLFRIRIIYCG